jgi:hypothetical protein
MNYDRLTSIFDSLDSNIDINWSKGSSEWQGNFSLGSEEYMIRISRFSRSSVQTQTSIGSSEILDIFDTRSIWGFKFYRRDNPSQPFRIFSKTPSKYPKVVMGIITNKLIEFLDTNSPDAVIYSSYQDRKDLYSGISKIIVSRRPNSWGFMDSSTNSELKVGDEYFFILCHDRVSSDVSKFILDSTKLGLLSK